MPKSLDHHRIHEVAASDHSLRYACDACGQVWSPNLGRGGRLPRRWWGCPNGCNADTGAKPSAARA